MQVHILLEYWEKERILDGHRYPLCPSPGYGTVKKMLLLINFCSILKITNFVTF